MLYCDSTLGQPCLRAGYLSHASGQGYLTGSTGTSEHTPSHSAAVLACMSHVRVIFSVFCDYRMFYLLPLECEMSIDCTMS